jgi:RimJ/RimL family protein N-acetyltransferase
VSSPDNAATPARTAVGVRPTALGDIGGISACLSAIIAERVWFARTEPIPLEGTAKFVAENIRIGNPQCVAEDAGRIVGLCDITRQTLPIFHHRGTLGMGLLAEYRGQGLGLRLLTATLDAARTAGIEQVNLSYHRRNVRAGALYRKAGFHEAGVIRNGKKLDGEYDDVVLMGIELQETSS